MGEEDGPHRAGREELTVTCEEWEERVWFGMFPLEVASWTPR